MDQGVLIRKATAYHALRRDERPLKTRQKPHRWDCEGNDGHPLFSSDVFVLHRLSLNSKDHWVPDRPLASPAFAKRPEEWLGLESLGAAMWCWGAIRGLCGQRSWIFLGNKKSETLRGCVSIAYGDREDQPHMAFIGTRWVGVYSGWPSYETFEEARLPDCADL